MKLQDIISYINLLSTLSMEAECKEAMRQLESILHVVANHRLQLGSFDKTLEKDFTNIVNHMNDFSATLEQLKNRLHEEVETQEPEYFRESKRKFDHEMKYEENEYILNRRLSIDSDSNILLRSHLRSLSDWRLPGLILRPGRETFIEDMVPLDPLYLVDQHADLLKPAVESFTPEYQRRLRQYVVDDRQDGAILAELPQGQFGLVFAYNYFNFRPIELIRRYLNELFAVMRSGGTLIMTYNNCNTEIGVGHAERGYMCYTPKKYIVQHAESIGFEFTFEHNGLGDLSWLEFVKPGKIESLRGGQTLAKIVAITE